MSRAISSLTARPVFARKFYDERLHEMLRWKRPHDTATEKQWVTRFITQPYDASPIIGVTGEVLAHVVRVGNNPSTMFSSHVDTMHSTEGRQKITFNIATNHYGKNDKEPLGADCAAGVWLMLNMIDAGVPGAYFFHRGEERGGIGSGDIASDYPDLIDSFKHAVAFDRRGTWSVITHQFGGRCCSDEFGEALAAQLNMHNDDFMYVTDDGGVFTDTANYTEIIPECTNLSVGYYDEHTDRERLDLAHLFALRDALLKVNWGALPVKRDPTKFERFDRFNVDFKQDWRASADARSYDLRSMTRSEMENLCYDDPQLFVDIVRYEINNEVPEWAYDDEKRGW